ncbi:MFS transporter [Phytohabitans sp. ZYX-F-186]|uniref:MFS transporter n=1 Tax=Phytohabitans maris TaxID=3071409 RepID=A0ABU0ZK09_9ACTN|nr:MFS transporter [Phytohabitans sp. ZYX-F-186]MDQ7907395.1 MFS transporter [Phytohabitans sp. ZYX-F-186]
MRVLGATFQSLTNRNLRLFFGGQTVSVIGTWLQKAAQAWLVLELTGSGSLLGVTAALQQLPTLLIGLWSGLLADRLDKRRIILATQSAAILPAAALGLLTLTGTVQLWMILCLALTVGIIEALDKPARHTFVVELVAPAQLTNAVTLNNTVFNIGKVAGPALAGVLIAGAGIPLTFFLNAASFLATVIALLLMRTDLIHRTEPAPRRPGQIREGLRYVRRTPALLGPLVLMAVAGTLAYEWQVTLPLLAHDTFDADPRVFGLLYSAMGMGAVVGGLALAGLLRANADVLVTTGLVFSGFLLLIALSPVLPLTIALLFALGAASIAFRAVASTYLQLTANPEMRGRVTALLLIAFTGTTPLGGPLIGWIGDLAGAPAALAVGGAGTALAAVATYAYIRRDSARLPVATPTLTGEPDDPHAQPDPGPHRRPDQPAHPRRVQLRPRP